MMRALLVIILLAIAIIGESSVMLQSKVDSIQERIVNGSETDVKKIPFKVSLRYKYPYCPSCIFFHICGAVIHSPRIILTAAQCIQDDDVTTYMVVAGTNNRNGGDGVPMPVEKIIVHENYDEYNFDYDIAALILASDLPINGYSIKEIPLTKQNPKDNTLATVSGWGRLNENGMESVTLQTLEVPIVSKTNCNAVYDNTITDRMICAGFSKGGKGVCNGDYGGPLVVDQKLVGITSWSRGCARENYPGVYTSIANLNGWIENVSKNYN